MRLAFLLDEDTERDLADKLTHAGHDVARVVTTDAIGRGAKDDVVRKFVREEERILVTHDDDHVSAARSSGEVRIFYAPDQRLSSFELFQIIQALLNMCPNADALSDVVFLPDEWL